MLHTFRCFVLIALTCGAAAASAQREEPFELIRGGEPSLQSLNQPDHPLAEGLADATAGLVQFHAFNGR